MLKPKVPMRDGVSFIIGSDVEMAEWIAFLSMVYKNVCQFKLYLKVSKTIVRMFKEKEGTHPRRRETT